MLHRICHHAGLSARMCLLVSIGFVFVPAWPASMSPELRLSTVQGYARSPHVVAYQGQLFVTWAEGVQADKYDIYVARSANNGDSWSAPVRVANGVATQSPSPKIGVGRGGVYVFWSDSFLRNTGGQGLFGAISRDDGRTFDSPRVVVARAGAAYMRMSDVLVDDSKARDAIYLAWYDSRFANGDEIGQALLSVSCDGGSSFTPAQHVSSADRGNDAESPRLALMDGTLFLLYRSSKDGVPQEGWPPFSQRLLRAHASACPGDGIVDWQQPSQRVSPSLPRFAGNTYGSKLVVGAGGRLHLGFWSEQHGNALMYRWGRPFSTGWADVTDLTAGIPGYGANHPEFEGSGAEFGLFGMGEDAAGNVHIAMWQDGGAKIDGFEVGKVLYRKLTPSEAGNVVGEHATVVSTNVAMDPAAIFSKDRLAVVWADFRDNDFAAGGSEIYYRHVFAERPTGRRLSVSANTVDMGWQLLGSTGSPRPVRVSVIGDQPVNLSGVVADGAFRTTTNCGVQAPGTTCTVNVTFSPSVTGLQQGGVFIHSNAQGSPHVVTLAGEGGRSLVRHYYYSIFDRPPDDGGVVFWEGEAARLQSFGVEPKEAFIVMANYFFTSAEYKNKNASVEQFLSNLYRTFFARNPDGGGQAYWAGQLALGMPRDIVMFNFLFSSEFERFMAGFSASERSRAEVLAVIDFYRGLLGRLPDSGGLSFWVNRFRGAQCAGASATYSEANSISSQFLSSGEYLGRGRSNAQYVEDLYNAFLRRGGDLAGFNFWVAELERGVVRESLRKAFVDSPEFGARINGILAETCLR